jgi:hypothetical protein
MAFPSENGELRSAAPSGWKSPRCHQLPSDEVNFREGDVEEFVSGVTNEEEKHPGSSHVGKKSPCVPL